VVGVESIDGVAFLGDCALVGLCSVSYVSCKRFCNSKAELLDGEDGGCGGCV